MKCSPELKKHLIMIALPQKTRKNGFDYIQVLRGGRSCIYEQRLNEVSIGFEVFQIRISPNRKILGKTIESREIFPSNEAFGKTAWSFRTWGKALEKFQRIEIGKIEKLELEK